MSEIIKLKCTNKTKALKELIGELKKALSMNSELICEQKMLNDTVGLLVFEKYYLRIKCNVALSVVITENNEEQEAIIVSCGGGDLFNVTLGADKAFASKVVIVLAQLGFVEVAY